MSGLTAVGALITGVEIWLEHDRASFANRMMWMPVALTPAMAAAGVAGIFSTRAAKTFLPLISSRRACQQHAGRSIFTCGASPNARVASGELRPLQRRNGTPNFRAVCFSGWSGGMGLVASVLRREG